MDKEILDTDFFIRSPIEIKDELSKFFKIDDKITIFDVGSCDGIDSVRYSLLYPKSIIYAFEPLKINVDLITKNLANYGIKNVFPIQIALNDVGGESDFYVSSGQPAFKSPNEVWDYGNKSSSLLPPSKTLDLHKWLKFEEKIVVATTTLFDFCENKSISSIDLLHLDVQGAELLVLRGAKSFIGNIKIVWLEVEKVELYLNQPLKKEVEDFMQSHGFYKIKDTVSEISGDQLWVRRDIYLFYKGKQKIKRIGIRLRSLFSNLK